MNIHGLQKLTLLDFPGHTACTVFLAGCNYRCPFCHNSELIDINAEPYCSDEELIAFLKKRVGLLDGVAFTGGEPLMTKELPELIKKIRELGYAIKLDTDGGFPDRLEKLIDSGLIDYAAMDVKNSPERYAETVGLEKVSLEPVKKSIEILKNSKIGYEFRTTVVKELHDEKSFYGIGEMINGAQSYYLQAFHDRDTVRYAGLSAPDEGDMLKYADIMRNFAASVEIRGV